MTITTILLRCIEQKYKFVTKDPIKVNKFKA